VTIWRRRLLPIALVCAAGGVVWWSVVEGRAEQRVNSGLKLGAAPLVGRDEPDGWVWRWSWSLLAAGLLALLIAVAHQRGWWWRVRQRWVLLATSLGAMLFGTLLALGDGIDGLVESLGGRGEETAGCLCAAGGRDGGGERN
jgi:drug/metabolite transporter (DMT)-like permease